MDHVSTHAWWVRPSYQHGWHMLSLHVWMSTTKRAVGTITDMRSGASSACAVNHMSGSCRHYHASGELSNNNWFPRHVTVQHHPIKTRGFLHVEKTSILSTLPTSVNVALSYRMRRFQRLRPFLKWEASMSLLDGGGGARRVCLHQVSYIDRCSYKGPSSE